MKVIIPLVLLIGIGLGALVFLSTNSAVTIDPVAIVGVSTPVTAKITNPHGVRSVTARLEQNGKQFPLFEEKTPARRVFWKRHEAPKTITFEAGKNKVGPSLHGIIGRKAGSIEGFSYSDAMKNSGLTWDEATLDTYLTNPKKEVPGNKMAFPGLPKEDDRQNVIAYLKEASQ